MIEKARLGALLPFFTKKEKKNFTQLLIQLTSSKNSSENKISNEKNATSETSESCLKPIPKEEEEEEKEIKEISNLNIKASVNY
jgi:hypothetical protein